MSAVFSPDLPKSMANLELEINVYPSMSRIGQYAIAVTSSSSESLVLGHTSNLNEALTSFSKLFTTSSWQHNQKMNYHTMKVVVPNGR